MVFPRFAEGVWRLAGRSVALAAALGVAVAAASAAETGTSRGRSPAGRADRRPAMVQLEPGDEAPDFELPRLALEKNPKGEVVGKVSDQTVRLSSFRGKRAVVLISSSYT